MWLASGTKALKVTRPARTQVEFDPVSLALNRKLPLDALLRGDASIKSVFNGFDFAVGVGQVL